MSKHLGHVCHTNITVEHGLVGCASGGLFVTPPRATIAHVAARHSKRARGFGFSHPSRARSLRARGGAGPLESDGVRPRDRWLANLAHEDCRVSRGFRVARLASTMKHGRHFRKLGRDSAHRWAMMRTMVTQLIEHERIQTTVARAKELRRVADRVVTFAKKGTLTARRRAAASAVWTQRREVGCVVPCLEGSRMLLALARRR